MATSATSDKKKRKLYTYRYRTNAIDITLYSLNGETVLSEVREEFKELATNLAIKNNLVINIATT
jgi:hypothetical protein